jgi:hypothetical protein
MSDTLVVLTETSGRRATKLLRRDANGVWLKEDYDSLSSFTWQQVPVADIRELHAALTELRTATSSIVIRGAPHDGLEGTVRRKLDSFGGTRGSTPRQWVMLDFDKLPMPAFIDLADDPQGAIEWLIAEHLPDCWQDVSCVWELSASAGTTADAISAHLWFYIDRPISGGDLTDYLIRYAPSVDVSPVRNDVQPHYVAAPVFKNCKDPLPQRTGLLDLGREAVTVPPFEAKTLRLEAKELGLGDAVLDGVRGIDEALALVGDGDGRAGFHQPLLKAVWLTVMQSPVLAVNSASLKQRLRQAIIDAPKGPGRNVDTYLSDAYLDGSITGAIRKRADNTIDAKSPILPDPVSLEEAEATIKKITDDFVFEALQTELVTKEPRAIAIRATPATGKTHAILDALKRNVDLTKLRVVYSLPMHKLAHEIRDRAPEGRIHRGRRQQDDDDQPMCLDLERAEAVGATGNSVVDLVCKTCPHWGNCGWSKQREDKGPGLILWPHQYTFEEGKADILIVDEHFADAALRFAKVAVANLEETVAVPARGVTHKGRGFGGSRYDEGASADLNDYRAKLRKALAVEGDLSLKTLREVGITQEAATHAKALEHQRADAFSITADMTAREIAIQWERFDAQDARKWAAVWRSIEEQISLERDELHGFRRGKEGDLHVDTLTVSYSAEVRIGAPHTLIIDGTASRKIIERFWKLDAFHDLHVNVPDNVEVVQITDRLNGKQELTNSGRVEKLARLVRHEAIGKKALLITHKVTEEELQKLPEMECDVEHFGNLRGIDKYKDHDVLVIAGRSQPSAEKITEITEAIFYKDAEPLVRGNYGKALREFRTKGGAVPCETDALIDERCEAVRWMKSEGELVQAFHRLRPIRRTGHVKIVIATNVPLPVRVSKLTTWNDLLPTREDEKIDAGVWLESPTHRARAFETAVRTEKRAAHPEVPSEWVRVEYLLDTNGARRAVGYFAPYLDALAWLRERLGSISHAVIVTPPPEETLEEQILTAISAHGLTQELVAEVAGISRPHLTNWIRGVYQISDEPRGRLAHFVSQLGPPPQHDLFT